MASDSDTKQVSRLRVAVVVLLALVVYMASTIVRIENERYALSLGMCVNAVGNTDFACLAKTQTRTAWWWHLWYALT